MSGALYKYSAKDAAGVSRQGVISAVSEAEAAEALSRAGLTPLALKPGAAPRRARAKLDDRAAAMRRLASLLEAKAPLDRALTLAGGAGSAKALFADLSLSISAGRPLSSAMADWPGDFSEAEAALFTAGEATGALDRSADAAATLLERRSAGRRAVSSALAYPAFIVVAAILALAVFIGFAQPRFEEVLRATGAKVSPATDWFFWASGLLREWGGLFLLVVLAAITVGFLMSFSASGKRKIADLTLRLPLIGPLLADRAFETFAGALGAMLAGGATLPEAARLSSRLLGSARLEEAGRAAAAGVDRGETYSTALRNTGVFPETLVAFVEIGEETGGLAPLLIRAGAHFGQEAETRAKRLSAVAAPAATAVLGLLIGVGAYLMMTAVLDVYDAAL